MFQRKHRNLPVLVEYLNIYGAPTPSSRLRRSASFPTIGDQVGNEHNLVHGCVI